MSPRAHPFRLVAALVLATLTPSSWAITYAAWVASYGLTGAAAEHTADPDGDGAPNLLEYALDARNPTVPEFGAAAVPHTYVFGQRTGSALPFNDPTAITYFSATARPSGTFHVGLRYRPRADAEGIQWLVEYADPQAELMRWFSGRSVTVDALNVPVAGDRVAWVLQSFTATTFTRCFLRLRINVITP